MAVKSADIGITAPVSFRDSNRTKDKRYKNCYPEKVSDEQVYVVKRPGLTADTTVAVAAGRGVYTWRDLPYSVFGTGLYNDTASIKTLSTSSGFVSFGDLDTGTKYLLIHDGSKAYQVETDDTVTEITDAEYPGTVVRGLVVIDGFMFVMDSNGTIYNSEQDTPLSWLAQDFISAEIDSDEGVAIAKHLNYLVAFGEWTTELFYNAGSSPGSPLARIDSAIIRTGCAAADTVAEGENFIAWVAQGRSHGRNVMVMQGIQPTKVSTKPIEKILNAEGSNLSNAYAYTVKSEGHYFYVLTLPTSAITLVYDLIDQQWHEWTTYNGSTETYFTGISACEHGEKLLIQDEDDGKLYEFSPTTYQDASQDIKVLLRTNKVDFGTQANKFMHRFEIIGDRATSSVDTAIRYTDDDYQTWSTSRSVDMSKRATLHGLGSFQRRAFELTFTANAPWRIEKFNVVGELGTDAEGANT